MAAFPQSASISLASPPIRWAQRGDVVFITFPLQSATVETINLTDKRLEIRLSGGVQVRTYEADLEFFKPVIPTESKQVKSPKELLLVLKKKSSGPYWPRLLKATAIPSNVKVDFEKWRDEQDSGDEEPVPKQELPAEPISGIDIPVSPDFLDEFPSVEVVSSARQVPQKLIIRENGEEDYEDLRGYEADIPELDQVPTLESILNQDDDTMSLEDLGLDSESPNFEDTISIDVKSELMEGSEERLPHYSCVKTDSLLSYSSINRLTRQLKRFSEKKDLYGTPTCIGSGGPYVAVGTTRGVVLLFDFSLNLPDKKRGMLKYVMGGENVLSDWEVYGSVTSLAFNCDNTRILVGHAKGQLVQWNVQNNVCLRDIRTAHSATACVLQVKYTDMYNTALFSDVTGSVYCLTFKRVYGQRSHESLCVFSGAHGEALTFEPLRLQWDMPDHPIAKQHLVAIGTIDKVIIISLKPLKAVAGIAIRKPLNTLPVISWKVCRVKVEEGEDYQPILAAARGGFICFTQVSCTPNGTVKAKVWKHYKKGYSIAALHWLASHFVAAMDTTERIHLIHVPNGKDYQVLDVSSVKLVYGSTAYKALESDSGATPNMRMAGQSACHNSIVLRSGAFEVFLLGSETVYSLNIATWRTRIREILTADKSPSTLHKVLELAIGFYNGKYAGIIGYRGTEKSFRKDVKRGIGQLINEAHKKWMEIALEQDISGGNGRTDLISHFTSMIETCLMFRLHKVLFGTIFDPNQSDDSLKEIYFAALQPFILEGKVPYLTAPLMKMFLNYYKEHGRFTELEACIINLDISMLDLNEAVSLCMENGLYDALIYVYNKGLQDYITPLQELLLQLRKVLREGSLLSDYYRTMGYKLLVYISCSLAGRAYPTGSIPQEIAPRVKVEVCRLLFTVTNEFDDTDTETYPHLRTLLHFDTREFLNVLTLAFEEEEFDRPDQTGLPTRQIIIDILMTIVGKSTTSSKSDFTPTQVGCLFTFLARQGARYPTSITVPELMYDKVLEYLTTPDEEFVTEERQQAFLELMDSGVLKNVDEEKLLYLAENAKFFRVCEKFYQRKRQFAKVLSCYWRDPQRKSQAFFYIHQVMNSDQYSEAEKDDIEKAIQDNFEGMIMTDTKATSRLFVVAFPHLIDAVTTRLNGHQQVQYIFLEGIFHSHQHRPDYSIPATVSERYIELMCVYQKSDLEKFLKTNNQYRVVEALTIVEQHNIPKASAFLKERTGDYEGAYSLLARLYTSQCDEVMEKHYLARKDGWSKTQNELTEDFDQILNLLLRSSRNLTDERRNSLWYKFLDLKIHKIGKAKRSPNRDLVELFQDLLMKLLNGMTMFISITDILQILLKDTNFSSGQFKEFKHLLLGMFHTHNYEKVLRHVTSQIIHDDVTMAMNNLCGLSNKGMSPLTMNCVVCGHRAAIEMGSTRNDVVLFHCGHMYHSLCLKTGVYDTSVVTCPKCTKTTSATTSTRSQTLKLSRLPSMHGQTLPRQLSLIVSSEEELDPWQLNNLDKLMPSSPRGHQLNFQY